MKSPFDFDISAANDKKRRRAQTRRGNSGAYEYSQRVCDDPNCDSPGKYRAPKSPTQMDEYVWFCLPHVREYNAKWNFFDNVEEQDFEARAQKERLGKTRPFSRDEAKAWARMGVEDPYAVLRDKATQSRNGRVTNSRLTPNERKAIELLGGEQNMKRGELRKIYKSLIKDLHPDRNKGSRADEERLNEVIWAWDQIKDSRNIKDEE